MARYIYTDARRRSGYNGSQQTWVWGIALGAAVLASAAYLRRRRRGSSGYENGYSGTIYTEEHVDQTIDDTFPASDPPSWSPTASAYPGEIDENP